jgi:hypothetical protein
VASVVAGVHVLLAAVAAVLAPGAPRPSVDFVCRDGAGLYWFHNSLREKRVEGGETGLFST